MMLCFQLLTHRSLQPYVCRCLSSLLSTAGWHTNNERESNRKAARRYTIFLSHLTESEPQSGFLYRHPDSGLVHVIWDRAEHSNVFDFGTPEKPLWHCVINRGQEYRLSLGTGLGDNISEAQQAMCSPSV